MLAAVSQAPPANELTLAERIREKQHQLKAYQRRTAFLVARTLGVKATSTHFELVNRRMKASMGSRDTFDESDFHEALAKHSPRIRRELLAEAQQARSRGRTSLAAS